MRGNVPDGKDEAVPSATASGIGSGNLDAESAFVTLWADVAATLKPPLDDRSSAELFDHCVELARSTDRWLLKFRDRSQPLLALATFKSILMRQHVAQHPWGDDVQASLLDANEALVLALRAQATIADAAAREVVHEQIEDELRLKADLLQAENREIADASRLKSEFLSTMSHELRTPLNAIIGFSHLLQHSDDPVTPKQMGYFGHITNSGRHLLHLIGDILDVSQVEAGKMSFASVPVDLVHVCAEALAVMAPAGTKAGLELSIDIESDAGEVMTDPRRLNQVLYNYLSNAIKFTSSPGKVTLRAKIEGADWFRIEVEDTGIGIAQEDLARLFGLFEQLDTDPIRRHQGSGLGLAVTRRLVEAQGGTVGVSSTPGVGSVFYAVLPRKRAPMGDPLRH